jgi:predicted transcriptional regulator
LKYRCHTDIVAMILDAAVSGETKTRIMLQANLNHIQLKRYIPSLLSQQLIKQRTDLAAPSQVYTTTEKGHSFLERYREVQLLNVTLRHDKNA